MFELDSFTCCQSPTYHQPPHFLEQLIIGFHLDEVHGSGPAILTSSLDLGALTLLENLELDCLGFKCIAQLPPQLKTLTLIRVAPETKLPDFSDLENLRGIEFRDCSLRDAHDLESLRAVRSLHPISITNCTEELVEFCGQLRNVEGKTGSELEINIYSQRRHEVPQNFRRLLSSRLRRLVSQDKLEKVQNGYKLKEEAGVETRMPPLQEKDVRMRQQLPPPATSAAAVNVHFGETVEEAAVAAAYKIAEAENKAFVAAEAVKEAERVSKMAEDAESILLLTRKILDQCLRDELVLVA